MRVVRCCQGFKKPRKPTMPFKSIRRLRLKTLLLKKEEPIAVIFSRPSIHNDGRVQRQVKFLIDKYQGRIIFAGKISPNAVHSIYEPKLDEDALIFTEIEQPKTWNQTIGHLLMQAILKGIVCTARGKTYLGGACRKISKYIQFIVKCSKGSNIYKKVFLLPFKLITITGLIARKLLLAPFKLITITGLSVKRKLTSLVKKIKYITEKNLSPIQEKEYIKASSNTLHNLITTQNNSKSLHIFLHDIESIDIITAIGDKKSISYSKMSSIASYIHIDLHEYFIDQTGRKRSPEIIQDYINKLQFVNSVFEMRVSTVSVGLANLYKTHLGRTFENIDVIYNAPLALGNDEERLGAKKNISQTSTTKVEIIHHGIASSFRKLDILIKAVANNKILASNVEINLMLVANTLSQLQSLEELKMLSEELNVYVNFLAPVKSKEIVNTISKFDLAFVAIPPISLSYANCLPNKFFESIHAGQPVIGGTSKDMTDLINKYNIGVSIYRYDERAIEDGLLKILETDIQKLKRNTLEARKELSYQSVRDLYLSGTRN